VVVFQLLVPSMNEKNSQRGQNLTENITKYLGAPRVATAKHSAVEQEGKGSREV
jgi:hypothetical protein